MQVARQERLPQREQRMRGQKKIKKIEKSS